MVRPSDWYLVGLDGDPTPGDGFGIRQVAQKYSDIAYVAANAASLVRGMRSSGASEAWVGDAGEVFRSETARMPGELTKADDSYSMVAAALSGWAAAVEDAQAQADRGLALARDAHTDLLTAQSAYDHAHTSWSVAHAQQLTQQKLQKQYQNVPPPSGVTVPSEAQLRATTRTVLQARTSMDAAQTEITSATARLDAAKRLVLEAKAARDEAEHRTVTRIGDAMANAVKPSSVWEAIQDSAEWQAIVVIATVVLTIVSIVAIFVGGPLVWAIIAAATVLLMVNALLSIAQGKNAWGELAMLVLGLIPGAKLLTVLGGVGHAALAAAAMTGAGGRIVPAIARAGATLSRLAEGLRSAVGALKEVIVPFVRAPTRESARWVMTVASHAVRGGKFTDQGNIIVRRWRSFEEGTLGDPAIYPANTFRSSTYNEVMVTHDTSLNRLVADGSRLDGGFWEHEATNGHISSQLDFALQPEWHQTAGVPQQTLPQATHVVEMQVPRGTTIFEGPAGPQSSDLFHVPGGAQQVYIARQTMLDLADRITFPVNIETFLEGR